MLKLNKSPLLEETKTSFLSIRILEILKTKRISIAGDAILTFKDPTPVPLGLQPVKNWRKFS